MPEEILKHTKSLSPLSLKEIEAKIVFDGNHVYMVKKDENGREHRALIETDKDLYLSLTGSAAFSAKIRKIHAHVSSKCNLSCPVCYETGGNHKAVGLGGVKKLLEEYPGCEVLMSGKEPTCREDLFELIEAAGKRTCLLTNGIKLKDPGYVKALKNRGLKRIFFSLNGTRSEIFRRMNGEDLLASKLAALENIGRERIGTSISATLARNVNEDQILPLVKFCFERRSFVTELRIRAMAPTGKHLGTEQICLSELIGLCANALRINKADILRESSFMRLFLENFSRLLPSAFRDKFAPRLCTLIFSVNHDAEGTYSSPGSRIDLDRITGSSFKSFYLFYYLIKAYGPLLLGEIALLVLHLPRVIVLKRRLVITLKCWPNLSNVDLTEMDKCPSASCKNGKMERFCLANIKNTAIAER